MKVESFKYLIKLCVSLYCVFDDNFEYVNKRKQKQFPFNQNHVSCLFIYFDHCRKLRLTAVLREMKDIPVSFQ